LTDDLIWALNSQRFVNSFSSSGLRREILENGYLSNPDLSTRPQNLYSSNLHFSSIHCGNPTARVHGIEPVWETFRLLLNNTVHFSHRLFLTPFTPHKDKKPWLELELVAIVDYAIVDFKTPICLTRLPLVGLEWFYCRPWLWLLFP
jgi:hypothetical protein